jgi:hypothetical protein
MGQDPIEGRRKRYGYRLGIWTAQARLQGKGHTGRRSDRLVNELAIYQIQVNQDIVLSEGACDSSATFGEPGAVPSGRFRRGTRGWSG